MLLKKFFSGLLATLLLTLALAACGDNTATTAPATSTTTAAATTRAATTAAVATTSATTTTTTATTTSAATTSAATTSAATTTAAATTAATTAAATGKSTPTTYPLSITDDAKRTVKFDKAPAKIVSLAPSNTELLYSLGLGEQVVGVDDFSNYPPEAKNKEKIGGFSKTNLEKVVSLSPDLILAAGITSKDVLTSMESRNLKVVVLNPSNLAGVAANIKLLAQITNVPDKGDAVVADFQKRLDMVASKVKDAKAKPRIFYELDPSLYTVGPGSFIDDMIQKAGGQNIVTDGSNPYPQLTQEAVVSKDPQVILVGDDSGGESTPDKIMARAGWSGISAVKNKRVVAINADLANRPGPRAAQGVEEIAKALYPELFK